MGVLTDLIIADKNEAQAVAESSVPSSEWLGIDAKGHSEFTLGTLLCVLRNEVYDPDQNQYPLLAEASEDGPWVFAVPENLARALNQIEEDQMPRIVSEWLRTEEMRGADCAQAGDFLRDLRKLAGESFSQNKPILMWVSL